MCVLVILLPVVHNPLPCPPPAPSLPVRLGGLTGRLLLTLGIHRGGLALELLEAAADPLNGLLVSIQAGLVSVPLVERTDTGVCNYKPSETNPAIPEVVLSSRFLEIKACKDGTSLAILPRTNNIPSVTFKFVA